MAMLPLPYSFQLRRRSPSLHCCVACSPPLPPASPPASSPSGAVNLKGPTKLVKQASAHKQGRHPPDSNLATDKQAFAEPQVKSATRAFRLASG
jgi:hypothetical protein